MSDTFIVGGQVHACVFLPLKPEDVRRPRTSNTNQLQVLKDLGKPHLP